MNLPEPVSGIPDASGDSRLGATQHGTSLQDLGKVFDATILAMASLAEPGEPGNHILRIQHFVRALAQKLKSSPAYGRPMSDRFIGLLFRAAPWHDIGNSGIPDRILLKPGPLTEEEKDIVKTHPAVGCAVIEQIKRTAGVSTEFLDIARDLAYSHQERWDGSGYPQGLAGERIPVAARLLAIADAYDALTSHRVYRDGAPHDKAVQLIFQERASHFDPEMVDAFIEIQDEFQLISQRYADSEIDFQRRIDYMAKAIAESP